MGAIFAEKEENWRLREDNRVFAVLEAVALAMEGNLCMRIDSPEERGEGRSICFGR
jgi:hypothetical protein